MNLRKILSLMLALVAVMSLTLTASAFDTAKEIAVVSREEGSGTRSAFIELTGVMTKVDGVEMDNTYAEADFVSGTSLVMTTVESNEYAIGYASLSSVLQNDAVVAVPVNGVTPSAESILDGTYPIARPFNIVTKGELTDELARDFMAFVLSVQGQEIVAEDGLVPVSTEETQEYKPQNLKGTLVVGGSTSVAPVIELLKEAYEELNPDVEVDVQSTGSSAGVTGALDGTYALGMASRDLKDSELEAGALPVVIGVDGIALIKNPANPIADLSLEQVRAIFTGEIRTWSELGE
ncbi:MAG: extracellular solute-binding protein [Clostridiales bacterium]|nr:extracellular solute-binding protein [Clostridiales bacterium]